MKEGVSMKKMFRFALALALALSLLPVAAAAEQRWGDEPGVKQIATGSDHTVAIKTDGSLWAWGWNAYGHLGNGGSVSASSIPLVIGSYKDWKSVSANRDHTLGIRDNATDGRNLFSWGWNEDGQLGVGDTANKFTPTSVQWP